jgi:hypothetical protein
MIDKITKACAGLFIFSFCALLAIPMLFLTFCFGAFMWGMMQGIAGQFGV